MEYAMGLDIYKVIYIFGNIFMTYSIHKFIELFYTKKITSRKIEYCSYMIYFIIITILHLFIGIPIILMIANIMLFIMLTFNYKSSLKERILVSFLIYLCLMCIETIVVLATSYFRIEPLIRNEYKSVLGSVIIRIVSYVVVLIAGSYKSVKKGNNVPSTYWLCIIIIPVGTLYLLVTIFIENTAKSSTIFIATLLVMLINFATFYLYDQIARILSEQTDKILMKQQNEYYENQLELMTTSLKAIQTIKHDLKNHITCIYILVKDNRKEATLDYLCKVIEVINNEEGFACTGNVVIDSIINFKLQDAKREEIIITADLTIPKKIAIPSFDITIILGNLLDNTLNAVKKLTTNRYINIDMNYTKGRLALEIENSFDGIVIKKDGMIMSSHRDIENHGLGLESVKTVIEKYNGTMEFKYDKNKFCTVLLMDVE